MSRYKRHPASYRDPAGFIFEKDGKFYRQVNHYYASNYELLKGSGLYNVLVKNRKLLSHTELDENLTGDAGWYKTLLPEQLRFVVYPYEWCFSQWKDAALLTLDLLQTSVRYGMVLKDATPFNIQFINGAPVFIDSLSFEQYDAMKPWVAYRQFIECFLAPILLAKYRTADLLKLFLVYPDGIPVRLVSTLLPLRSMLSANVLMHIQLPAMLGGNAGKGKKRAPAFTEQKLLNIISNLRSLVQSLQLPATTTAWNNYYEETILSQEYVAVKMRVVESWLKGLPAQTVLDLGTNTGLFALAAAAQGKRCIAVDADVACIERLYLACREQQITNVNPICADIVHPSPGIGWNNAERDALALRVQSDVTMALALVHHLAISKNVGFFQMAELFSRLSPWLIIEFVPKTDPKVQLLLQSREDIFSEYNEPSFLAIFQQYFVVLETASVPGTERVLFFMKRHDRDSEK